MAKEYLLYSTVSMCPNVVYAELNELRWFVDGYRII